VWSPGLLFRGVRSTGLKRLRRKVRVIRADSYCCAGCFSVAFPRDMALVPDETLLVSNYSSDQLEAVDVASIPGG
jgi:hypothetical protein